MIPYVGWPEGIVNKFVFELGVIGQKVCVTNPNKLENLKTYVAHSKQEHHPIEGWNDLFGNNQITVCR